MAGHRRTDDIAEGVGTPEPVFATDEPAVEFEKTPVFQRPTTLTTDEPPEQLGIEPIVPEAPIPVFGLDEVVKTQTSNILPLEPTLVKDPEPGEVTQTSRILPIEPTLVKDPEPDKITKTSKIIEPTEPPKIEPPKTDVDKIIDTKIDDIDLAGIDFIEQMMKGDDPIAELAFNQTLNRLGPIWEAQNADLILKLKQQGISGTNAGNAWLANMAQSQGFQVSDIVDKINYQSAVRMEEWNRYGPERANQIVGNRLNRRIDNMILGCNR